MDHDRLNLLSKYLFEITGKKSKQTVFYPLKMNTFHLLSHVLRCLVKHGFKVFPFKIKNTDFC